jgi:hypothetical protein
MERPDMAPELFFPLDAAAWGPKGRFELARRDRADARTEISGVRLHAADPTGEDLALERQCQTDFAQVVDTVRRPREVPGLQRVVLSRQLLRSRQPGRAGARVKFGLLAGPRGEGEEEAARLCHRRIVRAVKAVGLRVERPRRFDAMGGFGGLKEWGLALRLRRRRRPWWLLLFLLLLLPLAWPRDATASFFGVPIETKCLVLVVDKSASMEKHFPAVQAEARRLLGRMRAAGGSRAEVVAYDAAAVAALGELAEVTAETAGRLSAFLDGLSAGGGTNLRAGLERAAEIVAACGRPATLIVLTDGQDASIAPMLLEVDRIRGLFRDVKVVGHAVTPRLFGGGDPAPRDEAERGLRDLAEALGGRFGPAPGG